MQKQYLFSVFLGMLLTHHIYLISAENNNDDAQANVSNTYDYATLVEKAIRFKTFNVCKSAIFSLFNDEELRGTHYYHILTQLSEKQKNSPKPLSKSNSDNALYSNNNTEKTSLSDQLHNELLIIFSTSVTKASPKTREKVNAFKKTVETGLTRERANTGNKRVIRTRSS